MIVHLSISKKNAPQGVSTVVDNIDQCFEKYNHKVIREPKVYKEIGAGGKITNNKKKSIKTGLINTKWVYVLYFSIRAFLLVFKNKNEIKNADYLICHDVFVLIMANLFSRTPLALYNHSDGNPIDTLSIGSSSFLDDISVRIISNMFLNSNISTVYSLSDTASERFKSVFLRKARNDVKFITIDNFTKTQSPQPYISKKPKIWIIGTVCDRKRQLQYIEMLGNRLQNFKYKFNLLGKCSGDDYSKLMSTGLVESVSCVSDIKEYVSRGDILVSLSENEGLPMAMLECSSLGLVLISTDVGGCKKICRHQENGILLGKNPTIEEVDNAIKSILSSDDIRSFYSESSLLIHKKYFSPEANIKQWLM
ncbi:glycosyltransferase family 4 protein [Vibrio parahaemolyticus]